jgi:hypothetical protein
VHISYKHLLKMKKKNVKLTAWNQQALHPQEQQGDQCDRLDPPVVAVPPRLPLRAGPLGLPFSSGMCAL